MKRLPVWCRDILAAIAIVFLTLPSCFCMSILTPDVEDYEFMRPVTKRQHHDPWDLCPSEMTSVDCFFIYLRVYARLRREGANIAPNRMVGKRSQGDFNNRSPSMGEVNRSFRLQAEEEEPVSSLSDVLLRLRIS